VTEEQPKSKWLKFVYWALGALGVIGVMILLYWHYKVGKPLAKLAEVAKNA